MKFRALPDFIVLIMVEHPKTIVPYVSQVDIVHRHPHHQLFALQVFFTVYVYDLFSITI